MSLFGKRPLNNETNMADISLRSISMRLSSLLRDPKGSNSMTADDPAIDFGRKLVWILHFLVFCETRTGELPPGERVFFSFWLKGKTEHFGAKKKSQKETKESDAGCVSGRGCVVCLHFHLHGLVLISIQL